MEPFSFHRRGRNLRTVLAVAGIYLVLAAAFFWLNAAPFLIALLVLPTLPALFDLWRNPSAGLSLDDQALRWHSGRRKAEVILSEVDHMRFDTRWDFSVRVSVMTHQGKSIQLPQESLPPHRQFETELSARGLNVVRHHFVGRTER